MATTSTWVALVSPFVVNEFAAHRRFNCAVWVTMMARSQSPAEARPVATISSGLIMLRPHWNC